MRTIELRAKNWTSVLDFYHALLAALDAPKWHGEGIDAALDSIVWGGINGVKPPYAIRVVGASSLAPKIRHEIEVLAKHIAEHRKEHQWRRGKDVEVSLEVDS